MELHCFIVLFIGVFSSTIGSTVKAKEEINLEETVIYLQQRVTEMEGRVSQLENGDLVQRVREELLVSVRDAETKSLQARNQLFVKMEEMEIESRNRGNDLSVKLQELLKRVTEVEARCEQSTAKLQKAESRLKKVDNHVLMELLQIKPKLKDAVEKVHNVEEEFTSALERERLKTHSLQVQMTELNSELHSVDLIRKNMTLLTDNLRLQLNESLTFGLENIQTNLTRNMRIFENSYLKDCANYRCVSKLDENLRNLEKSAKNELGSLQSELSAPIEKLEERSALWDDVLDMKKTLTNHSSQLRRLNQYLWVDENTCADEPPSIQNGNPLTFERKHKSIVQYQCDRDFVIYGNSTVLCEYGKWEGYPPICSFFDSTFTLVADCFSTYNITCYSDRYFRNITFSRVLDTGSGGGLPTGASTRLQEGAVLDLSRLKGRVRTGAYECKSQVHNTSVETIVSFQYYYGFVRFTNRSKVANIGDTVELMVHNSARDHRKLRWRHNGVPVPSWDGETDVKISNVQPADAGIYECYEEGYRNDRQTLLRVIVRKCRENRYGANCDRECPVCYNGGICHDLLGVCICPVGFIGKNCEFACGENDVSGGCKKLCRGFDCRMTFFCKPDPYGCSCFPGFKGFFCSDPCNPGWYGADCKERCHCGNGPGSCNKTTGFCTGGCSPGWTGQSCQIKVVN